MRFNIRRPGFTGFDDLACRPCRLRIGTTHIDIDIRLGSVIAAGGNKLHMSFTQLVSNLDVNETNLFTRSIKANIGGRRAFNLEVFIGLELELNVRNRIIHHKQ